MRARLIGGVASLILVAALTGVMIARQTAAGPVAATISLSQSFSVLPLGDHSGRAILLEWATGRSHLLDVASGRLLAEAHVVPAGDSIATTAFDTGMRRLYVMTVSSTGAPPFPSHVCALDARSGHLLYCSIVTLGGPLGEIAASAQRVYVLSLPVFLPGNTPAASAHYTARLTILNAASGRMVRTVQLPPPHRMFARDFYSFSPPLAVDTRLQRLYVSAFDRDGLSVFDALSGRLLRTVSLPHAAPFTGTNPFGNAVFSSERLGRVYVVTTMHSISSFITLDAASGRVLGAVPIGQNVLPSFDAPTRRWLALDSTRGRLVVLDDLNGRQIGAVRVAAGSRSSVPELIPDERSGRVALLDPRAATVSILDGRSGRTVRTVYLAGNPLNLGVDDQHGHILVTDNGPLDRARQPLGNGSVRVVDERTGEILHTIAVGRTPYIISVDSRAGRALVLNIGGSATTRPDPWAWAPSWLRQALPFLPHSAAIRAQTTTPTLTLLDTSRL